jgi:hypothetical protein
MRHGDRRELLDMRDWPLPVLARQILKQDSLVLSMAARHGDILNRVCGDRRWDLVPILIDAGAHWRRPVSGHYTRPGLTTDLTQTPLGTAIRQNDPDFLTALGKNWSDTHTESLTLAGRLRSKDIGDALWDLNPPPSALDQIPPNVFFWNQEWLNYWIRAQPSWGGVLVFKAREWIDSDQWTPPGYDHGSFFSSRESQLETSPASLIIPTIAEAPNDPLARALPMFERLANLCGPSVVRRPVHRHGGGRPPQRASSVDWMSLAAAVLARGDVGKARTIARAHELPPVRLTQMALELLSPSNRPDLGEYVGKVPSGTGPSRAALNFLSWSASRVPEAAWGRAWGDVVGHRTMNVSIDTSVSSSPLPTSYLGITFVVLFLNSEKLAREALDVMFAAGCPVATVFNSLGTKCAGLSTELQVMMERAIFRQAAGLDMTKKEKRSIQKLPAESKPEPPAAPRRRMM